MQPNEPVIAFPHCGKLAMNSAELHQAVARYRVVISRWFDRGRRKEVVAVNMTYPEALKLSDETDAMLARTEPELAGLMCRSLAVIELTNREAVAQLLGHGPNYCHERAVAAVYALQGGGQKISEFDHALVSAV